jgi:arylsulfatase A-like enzyme
MIDSERDPGVESAPMKPLLLAATAFTALVASHCSTLTAAAAPRPNILFIYTDDHSYRTMSAYEGAEPWVRTPNMDRLAQRGVRFTHAYIGTWCMPSRATLLTGLHQYGVQSMRMEGTYPGSTYDPQRCKFWPADFRQQGYHTAQIGKWHTGTDAGFGRDWDYQIVWNRPKHPDNAGNYYDNQLLSFNGGPPTLTTGYSTDNYTQWAIDFIKGQHRPADKPWYLWLCYGGVHSPFTPADRHNQDYPGAKVATPKDIYPPRAGKPEWMQKIETWAKGPNGEPVLKKEARGKEVGDDDSAAAGRTLSDWVRQYNQAVRALDEGIGKVLAALEATGQLKNTLVIFTADQGFAWGQHGFRHKLAPYDANLRCPLVISMPGTLPEGKICPTPVSGVDLVPTIYSVAGLKLPWAMHGHDLTPLLKKPDMNWPHPALMPFTSHYYGADTDTIPTDRAHLYHGGNIPWYVLLVEGRMKYIRTLVAGEPEELYDLRADPDELTNLAADPKHAATLKKLREASVKELRRTKAGFADKMPPVSTALK